MEKVRTNEEVITHIKEILKEYVAPAVDMHGGMVNFISFENGVLTLQLSGSCSGCAGSTYTLQMGIEGMFREHVPEVEFIQAEHDTAHNNPYYSYDDTFFDPNNDPSMLN